MKKIIAILVVVLILATGCGEKKQDYEKNFFYLDTYIYVKLYNIESNEANDAFDEIDEIYKTYHELCNRYDEKSPIYQLNSHQLNGDTLKVDKNLYDLIKYGYDWYSKSNGLVNINIGDAVDIWKKYRDKGEGIPTKEELDTANIDIDNIELLADNKIATTNLNIDLGSVAKGYVTKEVGEYLEEQGIDQYLINAGGNILVGNHYDKGEYKIGIQDPDEKEDVILTVNAKNVSVVTSGGYERFYEYNGVKYHHIIDPRTLFPPTHFKSITVITKDSALGDILSTLLFIMDIDEGKEFIKDMDVEAVWYTADNEIIKSEGFSKYE